MLEFEYPRTRCAGIKAKLLANLPAVCRFLLPNGHHDGGNWRAGSVRGESGNSLSVVLAEPHKGFWKDFAESEEHSGDILKLWMMTRRIPFGDVLQEAELWLENRPVPNAPPAEPAAFLAPIFVPVPMPKAVNSIWEAGQQMLSRNPTIQAGLDGLRGWPAGTAAALCQRRLVGVVKLYEQSHWAFAVEYPTESGRTTIGLHARPISQVPGTKVPWLYRPNRPADGISIPAVPFVLGADQIHHATLIVITEGQWDAVAFAAAAGWLFQWPPGVVVFGIRGATAWKNLIPVWGSRWPRSADIVLLPDNDAAGQQWRRDFATALKGCTRTVNIILPPTGMDFSDWHRSESFTPARINKLLCDLLQSAGADQQPRE